jgi:hypothetical protein
MMNKQSLFQSSRIVNNNFVPMLTAHLRLAQFPEQQYTTVIIFSTLGSNVQGMFVKLLSVHL